MNKIFGLVLRSCKSQKHMITRLHLCFFSSKPFLCMQPLSSISRSRLLVGSDFLKCLFALRYFTWRAVVCCILCWELHSNLTGSCSIFITSCSPVMYMSSSIIFHQFIQIRISVSYSHTATVLSESTKKGKTTSATSDKRCSCYQTPD